MHITVLLHHTVLAISCYPGFIWRFYLGGGGGRWGGNVVDKDSKKGHNALLCTVGAFAISQL